MSLPEKQSLCNSHNPSGRKLCCIKLPYPAQSRNLLRNSRSVVRVSISKLTVVLTDAVVFRDGPEKYQVWQEYKGMQNSSSSILSFSILTHAALPVISVCPVKRPKLDSSGKKYSFK